MSTFNGWRKSMGAIPNKTRPPGEFAHFPPAQLRPNKVLEQEEYDAEQRRKRAAETLKSVIDYAIAGQTLPLPIAQEIFLMDPRRRAVMTADALTAVQQSAHDIPGAVNRLQNLTVAAKVVISDYRE